MFSNIAGSLMALAVVFVGFLAAYFTGNVKGKSTAKVKAAEQRTKDNEVIAAEVVVKNQTAMAEQIKAMVQANEIDEQVSRMSDADVLSELHNSWGTTAAIDDHGIKK